MIAAESWPELEQAPPPERLIKHGLGWRYETEGFRLTVDYLKRHGEELHGVLTIESLRPGEPNHVHEATHNFTSMTARSSLARHLAARGWASPDWSGILERFCVGVSRKVHQGEPFIRIGGPEPRQRPGTEWLIEDLVPQKAMTWWHGARGSVKSQLAALMAICVSEGIPFLENYTKRGRVGILDYEDSDDKWDWYLHAISAGLDIPTPWVFYRHCTSSLDRQVNKLARLIDDEGLDFLITDSFGLAGGPTGEHSGFDEVTLRFCAAAKELDTTMLVIDHISHAARLSPNREQVNDPFGSQYKLALARAGWEIRKYQELGSRDAHIGVHDAKHRLRPPIAVLSHWQDQTITFELEDARDTPVSETLPLIERILFQLQRGPMSTRDLSERLDSTDSIIRKVLSRGLADKKVCKTEAGNWTINPVEIYRHPQQ